MMIWRPAGRLTRYKYAGLLALLSFLALSGQAAAATKEEVMRMVSDEATRNGRVPVALALGVAKIESNFNDQAISSEGARGVMQIMPPTAMGEFGVPKERLFDPRLNIRLGIAYLERLYNQYGQDWELALSHYNGGSLRTRDGQFVPHSYTRQYVADVMRWSTTFQDDGTAVALANGIGAPDEQIASLADDSRMASYNQAEPNWQQIRRTTVVAGDGDRFLSDMLAASTNELRSRFRVSMSRGNETRWEHHIEQSTRSLRPHQETEADEINPHQQAPARTGRFNYAPYGSGRFL